MAYCGSTRKRLICLQKSDLCIYVVSNPGYSLMNHLSPELPRVFCRGGMPVALREPAVG